MRLARSGTEAVFALEEASSSLAQAHDDLTKVAPSGAVEALGRAASARAGIHLNGPA